MIGIDGERLTEVLLGSGQTSGALLDQPHVEQELGLEGGQAVRSAGEGAVEVFERVVEAARVGEGPAEVEDRDVALRVDEGGARPERDRIVPDPLLANGERRPAEKDEREGGEQAVGERAGEPARPWRATTPRHPRTH